MAKMKNLAIDLEQELENILKEEIAIEIAMADFCAAGIDVSSDKIRELLKINENPFDAVILYKMMEYMKSKEKL